MRPRSPSLMSIALTYFQAVARLGSIRAAGEALNVAPSAVSRQVLKLEGDVGAVLFERLPRGLRLTSAGEVLLHHSRLSGASIDQACAEIEAMRGLKRGRVSIATIESAITGFLPDLFDAFWKEYPKITVELLEAGSAGSLHAVADGETDLALAFDFGGDLKLRELAVATLRIGAVMSPRHPLATAKTLRFRDFVGHEVFLSDSSLSMGRSVSAALQKSRVPLDARVVTNSVYLMNRLAVANTGVVFKTRLGSTLEQKRGELVFVPLAEQSLKPQRLGLYSRLESRPSFAASAFTKALAAALGNLDES